MRRFPHAAFWVPLSAMGLLLFQNEACREGVKNGLRICGTVLLPALFPFSVLSALALKTGFPDFAGRRLGPFAEKAFSLPGSAAAPIAIGLLGGYPLGIHALCSLYREGGLTKRQAASLSAFCNNPGPAFLIGAVGAVCLDSVRLGLVLMGITLLSAGLTGVLFAPVREADSNRILKQKAPEPLSAAFPKAVAEATGSMLRVAGMVVFFSAFQAVCTRALDRLSLPDWVYCLSLGSLELTAGITTLSRLGLHLRFLFCALLTGWGGVCVHLQALEALQAAGLPFGSYLLGKTLQALISLLLAGAASVLFFPTAAGIRVLLPAAALLLLIFFFFSKRHWKKRSCVV